MLPGLVSFSHAEHAQEEAAIDRLDAEHDEGEAPQGEAQRDLNVERAHFLPDQIGEQPAVEAQPRREHAEPGQAAPFEIDVLKNMKREGIPWQHAAGPAVYPGIGPEPERL